jgi:hypothetical protein
MIQSIPRDAIIDTLLNTLEAERYVRGPLLLEVIGELEAAKRAEAAAAARTLLENVDDEKFPDSVRELRQIVSAGPRSTRPVPHEADRAA